jgi:hypothetical protein
MKTLKGLLKSKTFWFNVVSGALTVVNGAQGEIIPTETAVKIIAVGNIILRFLTNKALNKK